MTPAQALIIKFFLVEIAVFAALIGVAALIWYIIWLRRKRGSAIEEVVRTMKFVEETSFQNNNTITALLRKQASMVAFLKRYGNELKALKQQKKETDRFMNLAGAAMGRVLATAQKGLTGGIATPNKALREIILIITHTDIAFSELSRSRAQDAERKAVLVHKPDKFRRPDESVKKKAHKPKGKKMARVSYKKQRRLADKKERQGKSD